MLTTSHLTTIHFDPMNPDSDDRSEAPDPEEPVRLLPAAFHPDMQDELPNPKHSVPDDEAQGPIV